MASTVNFASSVVNNSSSPGAASASSQKDGNSRAAKPSPASRMTQKGRKESPSDSNRQTISSKAWSGSNPVIQQRASTPSQAHTQTQSQSQSQPQTQPQTQNQNKGTPVSNKNGATSKTGSAKDVISDKHTYDRLRFLLGGTIGLQVVLITKAGDKYEGVFAGLSGSSSTPLSTSPKITLKMTKKVINNPITQPNGISSWEAAFTGTSPEYALTFDLKDMADLTIPEFSLPEPSRHTNGTATAFQTDADISGNANRGERTLQRWVPDASNTADFSLESGNTAGWDQFATHAKMTGGQSSYREETYTTSIDRNAPDFRRKEAEAARIAREIESAPSVNSHVREERGQAQEHDAADDGDEEDKYSGVRRSPQDFLPLATAAANRYTPPALRAPSGLPSTSGAPFDPAIISSQVARPDSTRVATSQQSVQPASDVLPLNKTSAQPRAVSTAQSKINDPQSTEKSFDLSKLIMNGSVGKSQPRQMVSPPPERQTDTEPPSQGVERKVLGAYKQFADNERARLAEKRRVQANQDRTAKINDLIRFSTTFKLRTPVPEDLVGILAKDPKKQEAIMEKAKREHDDVIPSPTSSLPSSATPQSPAVPKFDKSQIPPPIPERNSFANGRGSYGKASLGRGARLASQQLPFTGPHIPLAPRGTSSKPPQFPTPIPMPDIKNHQSTAGNSGLSSPRGIDTPTSAVSTKFNVRAMEFRPTFNPSTASVSAASPSPIKRTASVVRSASPTAFFGQRKPVGASQRLDVLKNFDPIKRMKEDVVAKLAAEKPEDKRDFASNGGIPNAFHTNPVWDVLEENKDRTHDDFFNRNVQNLSPSQNRIGPSHTPYQGHMQQASGLHVPQAATPQHGHHGGPQYQPHFDDQRMHMQNGSPSMFASPNMTPRGAYATPMGHPTQTTYGHQSYFGNGHMPMRPYGNNAAIMHGQHGHMAAPMMVQQQSSGPYMGIQNQMGMVYPSPRSAHAFPQQQNGYPSPGPMAPVMMHQGSQQGYANPQMMYPSPGHGAMYNAHPQMGRGYAGNHTPYGGSPHQPHHLGQRAMSSGYGQKLPQIPSGPIANAPLQPAAFSQMPVTEEAK